MITVQYIADLKGAQRFGTCVACGKNSADDPKMVRVTYTYHDGKCTTSACFCDDCRRELFEKI